MFEKILIATDVSSASFETVRCTSSLAFLGVRDAVLAQCMSEGTAASVALSYDQESLKQNLEEERRTLENAGFAATTEVIVGSVGREVNRTAREKQCDMIVVGSHQHSFAEDILLGDLATNLILHTEKALLLLRLRKKEGSKGEQCFEGACRFQDHILFPTDFSENADNAFDVLENFASKGVSRITLLHVQSKAKIEPHLTGRLGEFNEIDKARLGELKNRVLGRNPSVKVDTVIAYGFPAQEIIKAVETLGASFVIMGRQGRGFFREILLGGVGQKVVRHAPVSVLLVSLR